MIFGGSPQNEGSISLQNFKSIPDYTVSELKKDGTPNKLTKSSNKIKVLKVGTRGTDLPEFTQHGIQFQHTRTLSSTACPVATPSAPHHNDITLLIRLPSIKYIKAGTRHNSIQVSDMHLHIS